MGEVIDLNARRSPQTLHRVGDWGAAHVITPAGVGAYHVALKTGEERADVEFRIYEDEVAGLRALVAALELDLALREAESKETDR